MSNAITTQHTCSCHGHACSSAAENTSSFKRYLPAIISFAMLAVGIIVTHFIPNTFFHGYVALAWYLLAYLPVGVPVIREALGSIAQKDFFNEFTLMVVATLGAFLIGEYPEGVAVMLFYSVGELFQESAVNKARGNIKALLDIRPDAAVVLREGTFSSVRPEEVQVGETIQVKAGEKVPLDGVMLSSGSSFNTSALTGESKPKTLRTGETVLAGMLNLDRVIEVQVTKLYEDSSLARILAMVQDATSRKAKTELLVRKFARVYTPAVFFLALAIALLPYFFVADYVFQTWLYRALVFLVISCPCALVISVPLGYFGGIGAASRHGILFKGANYLDMLPSINTMVMDKTGTLTQGVFKVQRIVAAEGAKDQFAALAAALESQSNHPIAKAIMEYASSQAIALPQATDVEEIAGYGMKGTVGGHQVLAGNAALMKNNGIAYDPAIDQIAETVVIVATDGRYAGYISIADQVKEDSLRAVTQMHKYGIHTVMLSGDKPSVTLGIANQLGIDEAYGGLLPEEKVAHVQQLKSNPANRVAFIGDGINDAPVLALSDIGIAMGGMGSDAAIEIADVVIQTDQPSKVVTAISIAKATKRIVVQNITMALVVKVLVLILGAVGIASMWMAVFADVGVALLAILNAVRILRMKFG